MAKRDGMRSFRPVETTSRVSRPGEYKGYKPGYTSGMYSKALRVKGEVPETRQDTLDRIYDLAKAKDSEGLKAMMPELIETDLLATAQALYLST